MNYLSDLARIVWPGSGSLRGMFSGPSTLDQMTENDRQIAELEQMGYGKFSPEVIQTKMQNPMMYAMGTGPIQNVSRRGLFDIFRSQKPPAIIKPTPPPTLDLSPTSTFDPPPSPAPTSNLPAVVDPEMFRAAQTGSGRAIEALSKQLGSDPRDQQALAEILKRAEGFINPELNRRQLLQSLAGAVARKVVGVGPMEVLKESVTPPKVVVDPMELAVEALEKWLPQEMKKHLHSAEESFIDHIIDSDYDFDDKSNREALLHDIVRVSGVPPVLLNKGKVLDMVEGLVRQYLNTQFVISAWEQDSSKMAFDKIVDLDQEESLPMKYADYIKLDVKGLSAELESRLRGAMSKDMDDLLGEVYSKGMDYWMQELGRHPMELPFEVFKDRYEDEGGVGVENLKDRAIEEEWELPKGLSSWEDLTSWDQMKVLLKRYQLSEKTSRSGPEEEYFPE